MLSHVLSTDYENEYFCITFYEKELHLQKLQMYLKSAALQNGQQLVLASHRWSYIVNMKILQLWGDLGSH